MLPSLWPSLSNECDQQPRSAIPPLQIDYGEYSHSDYSGGLATSPSGCRYRAPRNANVLGDVPYPPYSQSHSPCPGLDHVYQPSDPLYPCPNDCTGGFYNNLRNDLHIADLNRTYNATITFQNANRKRTLSMSSLDTEASKKSCMSTGSSGDSESSFCYDTDMRFIKVEDVSPLPASDQLSISNYSPPQLCTRSPDSLPLKYKIIPLKPVSRARFVASTPIFPSPYDFNRATASSLKYHQLDCEPLNLTKTQNKDSNKLAVSFESHDGVDLTMDLRVRRTEAPNVDNLKAHTCESIIRNGPSDIEIREQDSTPSFESVESGEYLRTCSTYSVNEDNPLEDDNLKETSNNSEQVKDSVSNESLEYLCLQEFFQNWKDGSPVNENFADTLESTDMHDPLDSTIGDQNQENPNCEVPIYTNTAKLTSTDSELPTCVPCNSSTFLPVVPIHAIVNEKNEDDTSESANPETVLASVPSAESSPAFRAVNNIEDRDIGDARKIQTYTVSSGPEFISECIDIEIAPSTLGLKTVSILEDAATEAVVTEKFDKDNAKCELMAKSIEVEIAPSTSVFETVHITEDGDTEASGTRGLQDKPAPCCHSMNVQVKNVLPSMPLLGGEPELPPIVEEELNEINVGTPEQEDSSNAAEPTSQIEIPKTEISPSDNENEKMEQEDPDKHSNTYASQASGVSDMIEKLTTPTLPRNSTMNFLRFFGSDDKALDEFLLRPGIAAQSGNTMRSVTPTPKTPSRIKSRRRHSEGAAIDSPFTPRLLRSHQKMAQTCLDTTDTPTSSARSTGRNTLSHDAQGPQSPTTFNDESNSSNPPKTRSQSAQHSPCVSTGSKTPGNAQAKSKQSRQRKAYVKKGKRKTQRAIPETSTIAEEASPEDELGVESYVKREREKMLLHDSWLEQRRLLYAAYLPDVPLQGSENMHPVVLLERDAKLDALAKSLKQPQ